MSTAATWGLPITPNEYYLWVQGCRIAKNVFLIEEFKQKLKEKEETHQARLECRAKEKGKPYIPKPKKQKTATPIEEDSIATPVIGKVVLDSVGIPKRKLVVRTRQEIEARKKAAEEAAAKERLEGKPEKRILNLKLKTQKGKQ